MKITSPQHPLFLFHFFCTSTTYALVLALLSLSACIRVYVADVRQESKVVAEQTVSEPDPVEQPLSPCALKSQVNSAGQETGSWCWAASAQLVLEYLKKEPVRQCDLVSKAFENELTGHPDDCCTYRGVNAAEGGVERICERGGWPETILGAQNIGYEKKDWSAGQNLSWNGVTAQICEDRPFIFVVGWHNGGRHSAVGGGYHTSRTYGNFVEVYDHSPDGFYVMPFWEFEGGGTFKHEYDYINLKKTTQ